MALRREFGAYNCIRSSNHVKICIMDRTTRSRVDDLCHSNLYDEYINEEKLGHSQTSMIVLLCQGLRDSAAYGLLYNLEGIGLGSQFNTRYVYL